MDPRRAAGSVMRSRGDFPADLERLRDGGVLWIAIAGIMAALCAITLARRLASRANGSGVGEFRVATTDRPPSGQTERRRSSSLPRSHGTENPGQGLYRCLWQSLPAPSLVFAQDGAVATVNQPAAELLGESVGALAGRHVETLLRPCAAVAAGGWLQSLGQSGAMPTEWEVVATLEWNQPKLLEVVLEPVESDGWCGYIAVLRDVTFQRRHEALLQQLVDTDELTGVATRRRFLSDSHREFATARRHARPLSVLVLDVDRFKAIYDQHGHAAGDRALQRFAAVCRRILRQSDIVGRLGGDEFALTLPETDLPGALDLARRIREELRTQDAGVDGSCVTLSVSVGIAQQEPETQDFHALLQRADLRLCRAKREGRGRDAGRCVPLPLAAGVIEPSKGAADRHGASDRE
jgi:diguanylate cyclase (GGDEF)-like protein